MPEIQLPQIRLYYEEQGAGVPILLLHGTGGDANVWGTARADLARLGRVIAVDRRGCTRSERPDPYQHTTPAEHAADATALLERLSAGPAIVIGRSAGGGIALTLALQSPQHVRALVLLEPGIAGVVPEADVVLTGLSERIRAAAAERGPEAAGETLLRSVLGDAGYEAAPDPLKATLAANGPAIVAETTGFGNEPLDPERLRAISCPVLVVAAKDSPSWFRQLSERLVATLPNARLAMVEGGHLITPADPQVVHFIEEVLADAA